MRGAGSPALPDVCAPPSPVPRRIPPDLTSPRFLASGSTKKKKRQSNRGISHQSKRCTYLPTFTRNLVLSSCRTYDVTSDYKHGQPCHPTRRRSLRTTTLSTLPALNVARPEARFLHHRGSFPSLRAKRKTAHPGASALLPRSTISQGRRYKTRYAAE